MATILVIDDEPGIRGAVRGILEDERYKALAAEDALVGLDIIDRERVDLVLLDVWLPRMGGLEALAEIKRRKPELEVVVISGHGTIDMAVRAIKLGAFDFIEKPLSIDRVLTATRNALEMSVLRRENRNLKSATTLAALGEELIGDSPAMAEVRALADQAAASDARVLITGGNGTGKELVARHIHRGGARAGGPFVAVNCAAIPEGLIESELFGHEKGAFTDAVSRRKGRFEAADGGTLFLDEVADLSPAAQAKLLRALQEMRFERLGSEETISVDVRILAATNKDVRAEIAAGRFREDLYFRLAVVPIRMPSLSERLADLPRLCARFLEQAGDGRSLSPGALEALAARPWPGNVRELRNAVERLRVLSDEEPISAEAVAKVLGTAPSEPARRGASAPADRYLSLGLSAAKELFEREYLVQKLRDCDYNISKTAETIGIYPSGLHAKIKKLGIEQEK
ncbi:MAG: sigma-54-dependent Fis family transcriptional regulator [Spirochaetaceae bacterium]|nr:sigma-54-dependent Fis family transcriptional regulator [Spirochaetaceae bacterium]